MKLTGYDLKQINDTTLEHLPPEQLLLFSKKILSDLKEAMDRLGQDHNNSSKPPSSTPPWISKSENTEEENDDDAKFIVDEPEDNDSISEEKEPLELNPKEEPISPKTKPSVLKRSPGKQAGTKGYGRTQELPVTETLYHAATQCALCNTALPAHEEQNAWTAFYTIDIAQRTSNQMGICVTYAKHIFFEIKCACGHHNRLEPYVAMPDPNWPKTKISQWRLVGARLAAMIVLLSKRYRNSRRLICEFLYTFLGIELSVGVIDQTIHETGRSVEPLEEELIRELESATLAYVDETSWKESGRLKWLWVFRTMTVVLFMVGKRDRHIFCKLLLNGRFNGIVMSDGWVVYREYANRLRCWAHLIRKARGLSESYNNITATVGLEMLALFMTFKIAIYTARNQPNQALGILVEQYESEITRLKSLCEAHKDSEHEKLRAFSRELLNDWDIIIRQIHEPSLPLTNNDAERILRHWVIDRRLSYGTRTAQGTRSFTLLASVIETCRIRGAPVWDYLTKVISAARIGMELPALPIMQL